MAARILLLVALLMPSIATAQYVDRDDSARFDDEFDRDEFAVNGRFRMVGLPSFIWNFWYEEHANHWTNGQQNYSYGGEFTWRRRGDFEIGVAFDYANLRMTPAFWLEKDEATLDQDWTEFDIRFMSLVFYTQWFWDVQPWFAPFVGVGVGPGLILGDFTESSPSAGSACRAAAGQGSFADQSCFDSNGDPDLDGDFDPPRANNDIPPILPVLQLGGGVRFNIAKYGLLKLELGFQNYLYAGVGGGVQW
jgi:hypothetical protein